MEPNLNNRKELGIILDALEAHRRTVGDDVDAGEADESDYHDVCSLQAKLINHLQRLAR